MVFVQLCSEIQFDDVMPHFLITKSSRAANGETFFVTREPSVMPPSFTSQDLQGVTHEYDSNSTPAITTGSMIYLCITTVYINFYFPIIFLINNFSCFLWTMEPRKEVVEQARESQ